MYIAFINDNCLFTRSTRIVVRAREDDIFAVTRHFNLSLYMKNWLKTVLYI